MRLCALSHSFTQNSINFPVPFSLCVFHSVRFFLWNEYLLWIYYYAFRLHVFLYYFVCRNKGFSYYSFFLFRSKTISLAHELQMKGKNVCNQITTRWIILKKCFRCGPATIHDTHGTLTVHLNEEWLLFCSFVCFTHHLLISKFTCAGPKNRRERERQIKIIHIYTEIAVSVADIDIAAEAEIWIFTIILLYFQLKLFLLLLIASFSFFFRLFFWVSISILHVKLYRHIFL